MGILGEFLADLDGFEWDAGNSDKNWLQHRVRQTETEQALLNRPLVFAVDLKHSQREPRFMAMGQTDTKRQLAIVFTVRGRLIRVISARPLSRPERNVYAKAPTSPEIDS